MSGGLQPPPATLNGFPRLPARRQPKELYRIVHARHRTTGALNPPWHYSSTVAGQPDGGGRFDLDPPLGTCYWSDRRYGAWVEVFRGARLLDPADARKRRLFVATPPRQQIADLIAGAAYRFGVTAEVSTTPDYTLPREWAAALAARGFAAVRGTCRHDPTSRAHNIAVFGRAGASARRAGWRTLCTRIETDPLLVRELARLHVYVAPIPHSVPTVYL